MAELALPWLLLTAAEERLPSSIAALLVACVPLVGAVLAWALGDRRSLAGRNVVGLVVGLVGVGALVGFDVSGSEPRWVEAASQFASSRSAISLSQ